MEITSTVHVPVFAQHKHPEGRQLVQTGYLRDEVVIKVEEHEPRETRKVFTQPRYRVVLEIEETQALAAFLQSGATR